MDATAEQMEQLQEALQAANAKCVPQTPPQSSLPDQSI